MSELHPSLCPICRRGLVRRYKPTFFGLFTFGLITGDAFLFCTGCEYKKKVKDIKRDGSLTSPRHLDNQGRGNRNERRRRWKRRQKFKKRRF